MNEYCNNVAQSSPLHFATIIGDTDNAKTLLKYGAIVNIQDANGNTPMHFAVKKRNMSMIKLLDEFDADARIKNGNDMSAIDLAVTEDLKEQKIFFMSRAKYSSEKFEL